MYFYNKIKNEYKPDYCFLNGDFNEDPEANLIENIHKEFHNSYKDALGGFPEFTSIKYKEKGLVHRCIDYTLF